MFLVYNKNSKCVQQFECDVCKLMCASYKKISRQDNYETRQINAQYKYIYYEFKVYKSKDN